MKIIYNENIDLADTFCDSDGTVLAQTDPLLADRLLAARTRMEDDSYVLQAGESDYSTIPNWETCYWVADHTIRHIEMEKLFGAKGANEDARWAACNDDEKDSVSRHFLVTEAKRLERFTAKQDDNNFEAHKLEAQRTRGHRIELAVNYAGKNILLQADRIDFDNSTKALKESYIDIGNPELHDWMNSDGSYVGNGFEEKTYFLQSIQDYYNTVVVDGNY